MDIREIAQAFLDQANIPGVLFSHRDAVRVLAGQHAGKVGELVTVVAVDPEPVYVVELTNGFDVEVLQSEIGSYVA